MGGNEVGRFFCYLPIISFLMSLLVSKPPNRLTPFSPFFVLKLYLSFLLHSVSSFHPGEATGESTMTTGNIGSIYRANKEVFSL